MCDGQTYRALVLSLCPSLLCLDGAVVTDMDILPAHHEKLEGLSLFSDMHHQMLPPVLQVCCGCVGLFCGDIGLFCGDTGLFCGDIGLFA